MTKSNKTYLVLGIGAVALGLWYWSRRSGQSFGSLLAGQGTAGSGTLNPSFGGSSPLQPAQGGPVDAYGLTAYDRYIIGLRGAATGPYSRSACSLPMRWIGTNEGPYYGYCVTQSQFDQWMSVPNQPATNSYISNLFGLSSGAPTSGGSRGHQ